MLFAPHGIGIAKLLHEKRGVPYIFASTAMLFPIESYRLALGKLLLSYVIFSKSNLQVLGHSFIAHPIGTGKEPTDSNDFYCPEKFWHRLLNVVAYSISVQSKHFIGEYVLANIKYLS